jgi:PAS domain S-box-containing protein
MINEVIRVCLVDDDEDDFILTKEIFNEIPNQRYHVEWVPTYEQAIKLLCKEKFDVFLVDFRLGEFTGIDFLNEAKRLNAPEPIIILTGKGNQDIDMEAMRSGAADYLVKDKIDANSLERAIRYSLQQARSLQTIKENEIKYRNVFEKTKDVIYITKKSGKFIDINDSATPLFGYTKEEFMNMNASELYANPADREKFEELIAQNGTVKDFEVELVNVNKEKLYCLLSAGIHTALDENEELYIGIIHDLTRRRKAEIEMMNFEKFAVTGRLARTIAHEVRNPLTNIHLAVEQLRAENESNEDSQMYIDIIKRNSTRINQLITELLDSSKPTHLDFAKHRISDILNETLDMAIDRIRLKEITLEKNYESDCEIIVDKEKIKIALLNIIINAVEAVKDRTGKLIIHSYSKENKCIVKITDNGAGITQENINRLFEPFFSNKTKGMGLGLTTTQNIIINHRGTIEVESEENKGTTFAITFNIN